VFPGDRGKPLNSNNLQKRHIHKAAADMGEPWICAHALRHTFATMLHGAGASGPQRQAALGHGSVSMSDHYTHADLEDLRERMEAISSPKHGQNTDNRIR
jgi:integrase